MLYPWTKDERNKKERKRKKKREKRAGERKHPIRDQRRERSGLSVWFRAPRNGLWFSFWRILRIAVIYSCYTMGLTALVDKVSSSGLYVSTFRTRSSDRVPDSFHDGPPPPRFESLTWALSCMSHWSLKIGSGGCRPATAWINLFALS